MGTLVQLGLSNCLMALVLALVASGVGRCCRRPALTHGLWLLVLLKLVTPHLLPVPIPWPERAEPAPEAPVAVLPEAAPGPGELALPDEPPPPAARPAPLPEAADAGVPAPGAHAPVPPVAGVPAALVPAPAPAVLPPADRIMPAAEGGLRWVVLAGILWLGGAVCWFALALARVRGFSLLLRHAVRAPAELQRQAETLAARLGLSRCPGVWLVPGAVSPMLWALGGSARLLVPERLLERLAPEQRATLLAHELAHLRRRDHWVRVLELLVLGLYWWFPLVWWARRELREAEEECCDAWVVWALPESPRAYATALVETLDFLSGTCPALPPAASGVGPLHLLRRRLTMIMRGSTPRALTGAGFLALCGLGLVLLPLVPSWAQQPAPPGARAGKGSPTPLDAEKLQLDKARAELEHALKNIEKMRAELEDKRRAIEARAEELFKAAVELKWAQEKGRAPARKPGERAPAAGSAEGPPRFPGMAGSGRPPGGQPDLQQRLAVLERKLDLVLTELVSLRHEMAKHRPGPGVPGSPGGFPFGPPGAGGGPPGPGRAPVPNPLPRGPGGGGFPRSPGASAEPPGPGAGPADFDRNANPSAGPGPNFGGGPTPTAGPAGGR
jgi:beta-lactamase regulating signal transducer with metallopeptidase domain